jgi:PTS system beta-glucosides-specific IIC component
MSDLKTLAGEVAANVGGPENVTWVGSCTTRLRFVVNDGAQVDLDALNAIPGVLQAVDAGGQVQVVIGTHVDEVRDELLSRPEWSRFGEDADGAAGRARKSVLDTVFDFLGGTFQPLIAPITGAAMVQVLALLLVQFGVLAAEDPTAQILTATGNAIFFFLPVFVGFTASRKLGANPFVGATIAAALLHPAFTAIGETGDVAQAFGLPLFMYSYASTMFPALLLALALAGFDRLLKRVIPRALQQVFVPTLELLVLVPLTALVFGPIGVVIGNGIGAGTQWLSTTAPFVFYVLLATSWVFLVSMGIHWALISIALADLATGGSTAILGAGLGYQYAIMGIALAVLIKASRQRDTSTRDTAVAATLAVSIGGITEPTLYGLVLRYRRLLVIQLISAACAGVVAGLFNVVMIGFSPAPILALPLTQPILGAVIAMVVAVVVAIVLVLVWGYEKKEQAPVQQQAPEAGFRGVADTESAAGEVVFDSPLDGTVLPLSETGDPVFAGELIGPGVSLRPSSGRVVAPAAGTIVAVPPSGHAIGLRTDEGVELLIHVGIDTVKLQGRLFSVRVEQGARVRRGDVLVEADIDAIAREGYSTATPVIVTNLAAGQRVISASPGPIAAGEQLLRVVQKDA